MTQPVSPEPVPSQSSALLQTSGALSVAPSTQGGTTQTLTGIDVLEATHFASLAAAATRHGGHLRLGLLTNQTGLDRTGRRTIDILAGEATAAVPGLTLTTLFSPEHGIFGRQDTEHLSAETDSTSHLPVRSLYGAKDADRRPKPADLAGLDAVVIDLQDAGVRFYTYETVTGYFIEAAAAEKAHGHPLEIIVLDRPALDGGLQIGGPVSDADARSYTDYMPLPARHGLTLGELARYIDGEQHLHADVTVIPMQHWARAEYYDQTGLPWINPSPNLRSTAAATLYPATALVESTNLSVGRGTATPFEQIGAPYVSSAELAALLTSRHIPGVAITPTTLTIAEDANHYPYHGQAVPGVHIATTDRALLDTSELGLELLSALHHLYPTQFNLSRAITIVANAATMRALAAGDNPKQIALGWAAELAAFQQRRAAYLLYP